MLDALAQGMREVRSKPIVGEQLHVSQHCGLPFSPELPELLTSAWVAGCILGRPWRHTGALQGGLPWCPPRQLDARQRAGMHHLAAL